MKKIYEIGIDKKGIFLDRPNRFVGNVKIADEVVTCHIHDSGRIKELLYFGNEVGIKKAKKNKKTTRKTDWDLICARTEDKDEDVLLNSAYHRYISENFLRDFEISPFGKIDSIKAEVKNGKSRLDFLLVKDEKKIWVEVKGVSLVSDKTAMFPDAPSVRAQKHLKELMELKEGGDRSALLLLVLRRAERFRPRYETDINFSELFYEAKRKGVEIYPVQFELKNGDIYYIDNKIEIVDDEYMHYMR